MLDRKNMRFFSGPPDIRGSVTHTHTHTHPFNGPFSGTTQLSRYQKGKTNLDFTEARDSEWQWHQSGDRQVCKSLQTDNHTSTSLLKFFLQARCPSCRPTNSVKALKAQEQMANSTTILNPAHNATTTTTTVLWPLYRSTCVSWHLQLRTGGFCQCKVLLPLRPC